MRRHRFPGGMVRSLRREEGTSLIELAFILPVFFLVTFGFINFAMVIYGMGNANFASRAALRFVTLHSNTSYAPTAQSDLNKLVGAYIPAFPANTFNVTLGYSGSNLLTDTGGGPTNYGGNVVGSQCFVTVKVTYNIAMLGYTFKNIIYTSTGSGIVLQ